MSAPSFDAVIAGGGLSGLSLAAHLAVQGWGDRAVLVVDDGVESGPARWGFWSGEPGLLDAAVSRTYGQVSVRADGVTRRVDLGRYRYRVVHRSDLRRVAQRILKACPRFAVMHGHVDAVRDHGDTAIAIVDGHAHQASWAFDSVTARPRLSGVDAWLAFTGYDVRSARPVFDEDTPTLLDFRTAQPDGARFVYVLPDDPGHAFVELTDFVPRHARPAPESTRREALDTYLREVIHSTDHRVLRTEGAVLPLRVDPGPRGTGRVLAIGARGGLIKASTGYAFQRIQRDSRAIAASLDRHGHPYNLPRPSRRHRLLDTVLLKVLDREPGQLERAFARLFAANPAERVLRFLDEDSRVVDELRLIGSLPPMPFLRALVGNREHAVHR